MTHPKLVESMLRPDFYPHHPDAVELVQTHISYVFIAGDIVYKIKKPVDFGFLDFTDIAKRKFYCEEELRLNKRLAPSIYLDIAPITEDAAGNISLARGEKIIDYAVRMKKLPLDKMLKTLLARGQADEKIMDAVADKVSSFHKAAETGGRIDETGGIATIRCNHEENFVQTSKYIDITIPEYQYRFIKKYAETFLRTEKHLFEKRVAGHKIRDCHGDLHLEHICIADEIIIFDCIEFNERFRFSDIAAEVAFLTMDLDFNGYAEQAEAFVKSYIRYSGDSDLNTLINFYRCYYAYVRGKVISFRLDQKEMPAGERAAVINAAGRYFDLACTYAARLEKPVLILTAGLMGSGKSYQARHLAARLGAQIIRTDVLRKTLLNIKPTEQHYVGFSQGIYSPDISRRTYDKAYEMAASCIESGLSVIIDASFKKSSERENAIKLARKLNIPCYLVECICREEIVKKRLDKRVQDKNNASDGRWEIFLEQKNDFDEIKEFPAGSYFRMDTTDNQEFARHEIIGKIKFRNE
ncbi:MAG TPA: AAA family ATPase [Smithellaceae bacterium]|nr:AAA family ATPase [Smithellaceae bacterium]